jgi:hypothetical protein
LRSASRICFFCRPKTKNRVPMNDNRAVTAPHLGHL